MSISVQECFVVLDLTSGATPEEIKQQYRRLAQKYHPDVNGHLPEDERRRREGWFKRIGEAYEVLTNPVKRDQACDPFWEDVFGFGRQWSTPDPEPEERIVVPEPETVVYNGVNIRVEYRVDSLRYSSTQFLGATLFVDIDEAEELGGIDDDVWHWEETLGIKARVTTWWAMNGDTKLFEFRDMWGFKHAEQRWREEEAKKVKKGNFYDQLLPLQQELRRLQRIGRPTAILEHLIGEADRQIYRFKEEWRQKAPEAAVMQALRAVEKEIARIKDGGIELLLDDLMDGSIRHKDVNGNQAVIDQAKIWSIRTGGYIDVITPESLREFYRSRLEGVTRVDELQDRDLALNIGDYDPTPLLDEPDSGDEPDENEEEKLKYAPDTVEIQGRKTDTMVQVAVEYDLYEVEGQPVPVGIIEISKSAYERNAGDYGKRSKFPELPHGIRLLIKVQVGNKVEVGFDDDRLAARIRKCEKSKRRSNAIAGVGTSEWSGKRWEPIQAGPVPPWYQGQRIRW